MPVTSSVRHTAANSIVSHSSTTNGTIALNELDNHADTICVGKNWRVLENTGELCSVLLPFSKDYDPTLNIPVARCATTYTCPPDSGQSILLIADQVLYFGDSMDHTLINPHQIRSHGYSLCDDPWDPNRTLGLDTEHLFIPFLLYHRLYRSLYFSFSVSLGLGQPSHNTAHRTPLGPFYVFYA